MNLSLYKLRKKLNTDKSGQSSLVGVILASVIGTVIVGSLTQWYISMNKTMSGTNDRLEAMTIAMSEWQRLEHMSLDELEANRENYKNPYDVGEKFKVGVTLGEQGFFDEGKCNSLTGTYAGENANCFKDTIMTVYDKDGNAIYTTRSLPLSVSRDSFPEGTILPYTGDLAKIPHGWVLCDGNNGTPDLTGRFLEGTKTTTGQFHEAGLPEISGAFKQWKFAGANGSFYNSGSWGGAQTKDGGGDPTYKVEFRASRSNSIYGKSNTVQPPSYTVFYIMKTNADFHYNHTNGAPTPNFYTKEEVDTLFKDKLNAERNYNANTYLPINSYKYVHNFNDSQWLGLKYDVDDKTIHGYVDGTEAPFASQSGSLFSENGYSILPNGLIFQWGVANSTPGSRYLISHNFNIPFPHKTLQVQTETQTTNGIGNSTEVIDWNTTSFRYTIWDTSGPGYIQGKVVWFAIGY